MTNENNNFDEMLTQAGAHIDQTLNKNTPEQEPSNPYKLAPELIKDGNMYDENGAYFHFKPYFQLKGVTDDNNDFETADNIYMRISRNPDKKLEINCKWARKTSDGFTLSRGFNIDFLLDIGDEKDLKTLNKKVSFSGRKNHNPSSDGTYVEFVEHITDLISETDCLEVFKEKDYQFDTPELEETSTDVQHEGSPQTFADYPPKVQEKALHILQDGDVFDELQKSVALTHEGHKTTRNALLLMEASLFVDDGAHGLLGGESGGGKTDLALTCALNMPSKNVHVISSNSPKDIFYDFEAYDDKYNILIFDDVLLNDELIKLIKLLSDNRVKKKVHKTVINGKAERFELKGKYEIIITYAKELPDEELANRLFNIGVNIVDKGESEDAIKYKIRDNRIIKADENILLQAIREPLQACIQYLIEHKTSVFNPYLSIYNPLNFNNRDINHLVSMTNARTFFDLNKRRQIQINPETVLTIGSLEDLQFVNDIWARDGDAQKFKLSERQKRCLDALPELTDKEAFDKVEELNKELQATQSREAKKKLKADAPLLNSIAKTLGEHPETLRHALDRSNGGNKKSLCEIGLVEKIKLDENNPRSPNYYYKIKLNGEASNSTSNYRQKPQNLFADTLLSPNNKKIIIINLLLSANICLNERGGVALENYCNTSDVELDAMSYDDMTDFLQGFFDTLNYDEHVVKTEDVTSRDILQMIEFKESLLDGSGENVEKNTHSDTPPYEEEFCGNSKTAEKSQNLNQSKSFSSNQNCGMLPIITSQFKEVLSEKNIDVEIARQTFEFLHTNSTATTQDIVNYIHETVDPEDFNNETTPLKIDYHLNLMYMHDLLEVKGNKYSLTDEFVALAVGGQV